MNRLLPVLMGTYLLAGCASTAPMVIGPDHPANPDAADAPRAPFSQTLAINATGAPPTPKENAGMRHDAHHMQHSTAPTQPGETTAPAARETEALFMCPMHPEVTSTNPNDRCPKCGMKINKPVKRQATTTATQLAPAPERHEGHGGTHP